MIDNSYSGTNSQLSTAAALPADGIAAIETAPKKAWPDW
jgi:hypothetical protein